MHIDKNAGTDSKREFLSSAPLPCKKKFGVHHECKSYSQAEQAKDGPSQWISSITNGLGLTGSWCIWLNRAIHQAIGLLDLTRIDGEYREQSGLCSVQHTEQHHLRFWTFPRGS